MPLISEPDQARLQERFRKELEGAVRIRLAKHGQRRQCRTCTLADELMSEIVSLSDQLSLERAGDGDEQHLPAIRLFGRARGHVAFFGLPSGFELPAFIDSIVDVSRGTTGLDDGLRERLARLDRDVRIEVFTTPT